MKSYLGGPTFSCAPAPPLGCDTRLFFSEKGCVASRSERATSDTRISSSSAAEPPRYSRRCGVSSSPSRCLLHMSHVPIRVAPAADHNNPPTTRR